MKYASIVFKFLIVLLSIFGIFVQIGLFDLNVDLSIMNYYTLISNFVCTVYFTGALVYQIKHFKEDKVFLPEIKSAVTMCITFTMLIVIVLLKGKFPTAGLIGLSFIILHYIVPIMVILDWIIFDKKGYYKKYYPFTNLIIPIIYYSYVVIMVHSGYRFSDISAYPYPFQDVFELGYLKVIITDIMIAIFFIGLGYLYYFIDHKLFKKS